MLQRFAMRSAQPLKARLAPHQALLSASLVGARAQPSLIVKYSSASSTVVAEEDNKQEVRQRKVVGDQKYMMPQTEYLDGRKNPNQLFVANFPWSMGITDLKAAFEPFGKVTFCKISFDPKTGNSKGYGFVGFETAEALEAVLAKSDEFTIEGRKVDVRKHKEPQNIVTREPQHPPSNILYIGNLDFYCQRMDVIKLLSNFGQLLNVRMPVDVTTGRYRGFCFAEFATLEDCQAAMKAIRGQSFRGRILNLDFAPGRFPRQRDRQEE